MMTFSLKLRLETSCFQVKQAKKIDGVRAKS